MWSSYLLWFRLHWRLAPRCFIIQGWTFDSLWPWRNNDLIPWRKFHWRNVFYSKMTDFPKISNFWKLDFTVIYKTKKAFDGLTPVKNGIPIYVQGTMDVPEEYSSDSIIIDSCVASPGTLEGLVPVNSNDPFWPLINEGCLNDHTVEILPRGENGEIRFSFEGFTFHSYEDKAVSFQILYFSKFFELWKHVISDQYSMQIQNLCWRWLQS